MAQPDSDLQDMTGVVLAGGRSARMGCDKARLELAGRTLAARAVERLRTIFPQVLAATNDAAPFAGLGVTVVKDRLGAGPLAGIAAALGAAPTAYVFCCAVDMPFLDPPLVRWLCSLRAGYDIVVPCGAEGMGRSSPLEPLHAVYGRGCLPRFEERLGAGRFKIDAAMEGLRVRVVDPEEWRRLDPQGRSFWNANAPEDWDRVRREAEDGERG